MKINIAVCDDEVEFANKLVNSMKDFNWQHLEKFVDIYSSGTDLIHATKIGKRYDIIFLDLEYENSNYLGMNIGTAIKSINPEVLIIYVSSYDKYYMDLVTAEPFYFLRKPIIKEELKKALSLSVKRINYINHGAFFTYRYNGVEYKINLVDVMYFESQHRLVNAHLTNGTIVQFYSKLDDVEQEVDTKYPFFLRANKSYLINHNYAQEIKYSKVVINNETISVSPKYKDAFSKKYLKIYNDNN